MTKTNLQAGDRRYWEHNLISQQNNSNKFTAMYLQSSYLKKSDIIGNLPRYLVIWQIPEIHSKRLTQNLDKNQL